MVHLYPRLSTFSPHLLGVLAVVGGIALDVARVVAGTGGGTASAARSTAAPNGNGHAASENGSATPAPVAEGAAR